MPRVVIDPAVPESEALNHEIARLRGLDVGDLRARWHTALRRRAPPHLPRHLLFRILAYRLQADRLGELDADSRRLLDRIGQHREITVIARDRGGGYSEAAARALPHAVQVADRWHLMENASRAFLDAVRKSMRQIRTAIGATTIDPGLLTAADRIQYEGYLRREETNAAILALAKEGVPIREIVRRLGYSRKLVRHVVRGERHDVFRVRQSSLDVHLPWLDAQWSSGRCNGADLWRRLKQQEFRGSLRVVTEWATRRRRAERADGHLE